MLSRRSCISGVLVSALLLLSSMPAHAQVDRATLSGIVKDSDGAGVPGATIVVTNLGTDVETRQQTGDGGGYQIGNLIPGRYRVEVELTGFKKVAREIELRDGPS